MEGIPFDKKIILFDGVCNLCEYWVQFIIKHDHKDVFRFVALQSELGQQVLKHIGVNTEKVDSIILYEPGVAYYYKAEAAMHIASHLKTWHKYLRYLLFTGTFGNFIYDYVARNRYKWYGKKDQCLLPTPEIQAKFL
jgi:predicted DCC family thiol-disulfide oxidoreductase YuxK